MPVVVSNLIEILKLIQVVHKRMILYALHDLIANFLVFAYVYQLPQQDALCLARKSHQTGIFFAAPGIKYL